MEFQSRHSLSIRTDPRIALALCAAVLLSWVTELLVHNRPAYAEAFAPEWLPIAAAGITAAGILRLNTHPQWLRILG